MSNRDSWENSDGLSVGFGPRKTDANASAVTAVEGAKGELTFYVYEKDLITDPTASAGSYHDVSKLPAGTSFLAGTVDIIAPFNTISGLGIGVYDWTTGGDVLDGARGVPNSIAADDATGILDPVVAGDILEIDAAGVTVPTTAFVSTATAPEQSIVIAYGESASAYNATGVARVVLQYVVNTNPLA